MNENENSCWKINCKRCNKELYYKTKYTYNRAFAGQQLCINCSRTKYIYPNELKRNCPKCNIKIVYKSYSGYIQAIKHNSVCKKCCNVIRKYPSELRRNCPKCGKELIYKNKKSFARSIRKNYCCKCCRHHTLYDIKDLKRLCPKCGKEIIYKTRGRFIIAFKNNSICKSCVTERNRQAFTGRMVSEETRRKQRMAAIGRIHSDDTRKKLRLIMIDKITQNGHRNMRQGFNKKACDYLDKLSKENQWKLQHALNGGEFFIKDLGYWVDGYDKEKNIVVEYDEIRHKKHSCYKNDSIRQNEIIHHLNCRFFRYKEWESKLIEVFS